MTPTTNNTAQPGTAKPGYGTSPATATWSPARGPTVALREGTAARAIWRPAAAILGTGKGARSSA
eukprot:1603707-Alexandrium_andersonii.AAC.1